MTEIYNLWEKNGNKIVMFGIAAYLYAANERQEMKIEQIEAKLYDCYEDKQQRNSVRDSAALDLLFLEAILPENPVGKIEKG